MLKRFAAFPARHPLFAAALLMAVAVALADRLFFAGLLWVVLASGLAAWRGHRIRAVAWCCCGLMALGTFTWRNHRREAAGNVLLPLGETIASGRVTRDADGDEHSWRVRVILTDGPAAGAAVWWQGRGEAPVAGALVRGKGSFRPLPELRNPGEFDGGAFLRRQGIAAVFEANVARPSVETGRWAALGAWVRHGFRTGVTAGLDENSPAAMTIRAVVIGEYPQDGDDLVAAFRNSGTLHIFSVSGMHVAMVASIGWLVLRRLGVPRRAAVGVLLALVFGYTWITGNSPPAVRSAWMAAVFLGAFVWRRRPDLLSSLGLVLFLAVLWDGNLLFQPGVQLSYGVVAAIAFGTRIFLPWFGWISKPTLYLPLDLMTPWQRRRLEWRRWLASGLAASVAAFTGSTPLTIWHFGLLTPVSVVATIALALPVYVLLGLALFAAAIHPFAPGAAAWVNRGNALVAGTCNAMAAGFSAIPGANFNLRHNREPVMIVYDLDYGAGASVFASGQGGGVLFDCGDRFSFKSRVAPSMRRLGISPDSVVLSHPDGLHLGGAAPVWSAFPVRQALLPVERSLSKTYQAWCCGAPAAGVRTIQAASVSTLPLAEDASLEVLHVPDQRLTTRLADDRVAVFRLHWRGWKILLLSDAGALTEQAMLSTGRDITADVIIAGRHDRDRSLGDDFIRRVVPRAIIVSNEPFPPEERLDPRQVAYWQGLGIHVFDQAATGGVTLRPTEQGLEIRGFADDTRVLLPKP